MKLRTGDTGAMIFNHTANAYQYDVRGLILFISTRKIYIFNI
jgi:hypothetical protein